MSKFDGKELVYAKMHTTAHIPMVGEFGPVLNSVASGISKAVKMTVSEPFVIVEVPTKTGKVTFNVPIVNFSHMVVKEDAQGSKA